MENYVIECTPEQLELLKKLAAENIEVEVLAKGQTPLNIDRALVIIKNIQAQTCEDIKKLDSRLTGRKAITLYHAITYKYLNKKGYRFSRGAKSLSKIEYFRRFKNEIGTRQTLHNYIKIEPINKTDKEIFKKVETELEKAFISARFLS